MTSSITVIQPDTRFLYPIEAVSKMTGIPKRTIGVYCRKRLVAPVQDPEAGGWFFSCEAIRSLREVEYLRNTRGVNLEGIRVILDLLSEADRLHQRTRLAQRL